MRIHSTTAKPLPLITYDVDDPVLTGLRIGNVIWRAVNAAPLPQYDERDPLLCSRTFTPKKEGSK